MQIDVSVVVPVYNTEKYLRQCVDSLLNQSLKNVEFIFVDDGSTDHSMEILEEYRQRDNRITILRQKNQYAGVARNNGMATATGKYIIFLDSDDFFEPNMLEFAFRCAEKNHAEIVIFGFNYYDTTTGSSIPFPASFPDKVFSANETEDMHFFEKCYAAPWNKLFLRSFIEKNGLRFQTVRKCNDAYFVVMSIILADRIKYLKRNLVHYRTNNPNSLQGNMNSSRECYIDCRVSIKKKTAEVNKYHGNIKEALNRYITSGVRCGAAGTMTYEEYFGYYSYVKQNLIPNLFGDEQDFIHDSFVTHIYHSCDFNEFLFLQLKETEAQLATEFISKKSYDYRVGHMVMSVPRKIKKYIQKR